VGFWEVEVVILESLTCLDLGMVRVIVKILLKIDRKGLFVGNVVVVMYPKTWEVGLRVVSQS
jgi:hypothetical protein